MTIAWFVFGLAFLFTFTGYFLLWKIPQAQSREFSKMPRISIIIPARNEEKRLLPLLNSLQAEKSLIKEVLVVDDHSTDATALLAKKYGANVISAAPLPHGWLGKPWACYQGAQQAQGDHFLFLDADTSFEKGGLARLISLYFENDAPLSVQPFHRVRRFHEQFSLFFNLIVMMTTGLFTPLQKRITSQSFFGPCQIIAAEDYWKMEGHAAAKNAILEDIALGRALQDKTGKSIRAVGGKSMISFRMYEGGWRDLIEGWSKNFASGASLMPGWMLTFVSVWITGLFIFVLSGVAPFMWQDNVYGIGYGVGGLITVIMSRKVGSFSILTFVLYPVYLVFFVFIFVRSSLLKKSKKGVTWKGRKIDL